MSQVLESEGSLSAVFCWHRKRRKWVIERCSTAHAWTDLTNWFNWSKSDDRHILASNPPWNEPFIDDDVTKVILKLKIESLLLATAHYVYGYTVHSTSTYFMLCFLSVAKYLRICVFCFLKAEIFAIFGFHHNFVLVFNINNDNCFFEIDAEQALPTELDCVRCHR